ncbi:MAG: hypothetical protein R2751_00775 [Bacteroidales bacterium]
MPKDSSVIFKWIVKESYDECGRVTRLDFLENGKLINKKLCYLPAYVTYEYPDSKTIIEELFESDGQPMNGVVCEVPYKRIYSIDDEHNITALEIDYFIDTISIKQMGMNSRNIQVELDYLKNTKQKVSEGDFSEFDANFVRYYFKSYSKYNRIFPIRKGFNKELLSGTGVENEDAYNCIK